MKWSGRALEYLLTGFDATGADAERLGWINQAFESTDAMDAFVNDLAQRIAIYLA